MGALIKLSVAHGNVAYASHPVAVGHYENDSITGAELFLNRNLGNRLKYCRDLGRYPGPLGTAEVFLNPERGAKPAGAVVVGLGVAGSLTPYDLAAAFSRATLAYALTVTEQPAGQQERVVSLSTLLIGSGAGGITIRESVKALLSGFWKSQCLLKDKGYASLAHFESLEFLELWQDRAIQAARTLTGLATDPDLKEHFDWSDISVSAAPGGRSRVTFSEDLEWSRRLRVVAEENGSLRFSVMGDRSRSDVTLLPTQRALVDRLLESATKFTGSDSRVARTMFELLIPNALKEAAPREQNLLLILDEETARYPWELLEDGTQGTRHPLAVDISMIRQLETLVSRRAPSTETANRALIIADPKSRMAELPGAEREESQVRGRLQLNGYQVESRVRAESLEILEALYANSYRILHLCGHGVFQRVLPDGKGTVSGMVIGDDVLLTPVEIEQMRRIPELVFVNCCYLGKMEARVDDPIKNPNQLAANLAAQFIRIGVRAVVAAGWAVDDAAALTFSCTFYEQMLGGETFSRAVQRARKQTYSDHSAFNTWGAYQCYGDPDFTLVRDAIGVDLPSRGIAFHLPSEVVCELDNLASDAKAASANELTIIRQRLATVRDAIPSNWLNQAQVQAALGRTFAEVGAFAESVGHCRQALNASDAHVSLRDLEQMANIQSRCAIEAWRQRVNRGESIPAANREAAGEIDESIATLSALLKFGEHGERLSLLASSYKRKAWVSSGRERIVALSAMRDTNLRAYKTTSREGRQRAAYPLFNYLIAFELVKQVNGDTDAAVDPALYQELEGLNGLAAIDFWGAVLPVDGAFVKAFIANEVADNAASLVNAYRSLKVRGASPREFRSVMENLEFVRDMTTDEEVAHAMTSMIDGISAS